ncbi:hypothetical protein HK100_010680, partial [Physocladia obscura]
MCTPSQYLAAVTSLFINTEPTTYWLECILYFLRPLVQSVSIKKPQHSGTAPIDLMDIENADDAVEIAPLSIQIPKIISDRTHNLLNTVENFVISKLKEFETGIVVTNDVLDAYIAGFRVFEQLMFFKEVHQLDLLMSLESMFEIANSCLETMSSLIEASKENLKLVDLGSLFLSIQLHRLEKKEDPTEEELNLALNQSWLLLKAGWGHNKNTVHSIHKALTQFLQKCASLSAVSTLLEKSVDLVENLSPYSLGVDNILSADPDLLSAL